jgi:hypothetical protein
MMGVLTCNQLILILCPTNVLLPCGPAVLAGGHARHLAASRPTQTCRKFGPGMGQAGSIDSAASHRWNVRNQRAGLVGRVRTRAYVMRRLVGDAIIFEISLISYLLY